MCVSIRDCICNSRPTVAPVRLISAVVSFLFLSVKTQPQLLSHNYLSLLQLQGDPGANTHFTPVSACTDYVVIAETMGQLNFHYLNDYDTSIIAINALAPR